MECGETQLQNANNNFNNDKIYLNHFSGTGGAAALLNNVYPWFVASGKESRNTDSNPKMIQKATTNAWEDFPRDINGQVFFGGMKHLGPNSCNKVELNILVLSQLIFLVQV